jgi:putative flippase GtrA
MTVVAQSGTAVPVRPTLGSRRGRFFFGRDLVIYLVFGGVAAGVNLLAGWLLYGAGLAPFMPYWLATGCAAAIGLVTNFALNHALNFRFRGRPAFDQFRTFCAIAGIGVLLTSLAATLLRSGLQHFVGTELGLGGTAISAKFAAHVAAVGLVVVYSYPAHKAISFNVGLRARLRQFKATMAG